MNKCILMGRLTADPKIEWTRSEESKKYATYMLAVSRRYKREGQPEADFVPCVAWGFHAEFAEKYMKKGVLFLIIGRLTVNSWTDNEGKKHRKTFITVEESYFTGDKGKQAEGGVPDGFYPIAEGVEEDDLPF